MSNDKQRSLHVTWDDPRAAAEMARSMAGLEYLTAVMNGQISAAPIGQLLGIRLVKVEKGSIAIAGQPGEQHYNPIGLVHGGYMSTMLDSAMGCAVHTELPAGAGYSTVALQINFVRPVDDRVRELCAEGRVVHLGKRQATAEGTLRDNQGKLYAHGTSTCLIIG